MPLAELNAALAAGWPLKPHSVSEGARGAASQETESVSATAGLSEKAVTAVTAGDGTGLTAEDREIIEDLRARDRAVRDHEEAHAQVGQQHAGAPSYTFQTGPDGRNYAIGGQVAIDVAPVAGDPEATMQKMEIVKAAALAPIDPSAADQAIAAHADAIRAQAAADLAALRAETLTGTLDRAV